MSEAIQQIDIGRLISLRAKQVYNQVLSTGYFPIHSETSEYDVSAATQLEDYGFVYRNPGPSGYQLLPTPFEILIPSLLHRIDWSYPPFSKFTPVERDKFRESLVQLRDTMPVSVVGRLKTPMGAQALEGTAEIDSFITRILPVTKEVSAISAAEWSNNLPLLWASIVQRLKEGMRYRRIVSPIGLSAFGWNINHRDTTEIGVNLRVSLKEIASPFYLFYGDDLRSSLVFVSSLQSQDQPRATYTALGQLTNRLSKMFDDLWHSAAPAQPILEQLKSYRPLYIDCAYQACGEPGKCIASKLFDKGIFSQFAESDEPFLCDLVNSGLAISSNFKIGLTCYVPNILDEITRCVLDQGACNDI